VDIRQPETGGIYNSAMVYLTQLEPLQGELFRQYAHQISITPSQLPSKIPMNTVTGKPISFWIDSTPETEFPPLTQDVVVDVAIVGGGIAGLTAAMLLKRAGKTVAVLESRKIVTGASGHTTAKVTSLHQLIYADLLHHLGVEKARVYAESNQAALEQVAKFVEQEQIDCDFSRRSAYTFTEAESGLKKIEAEVDAALKLGLPASFVQETSLPFAIAGAIRFDHQAQFHPRKYLLHLAQCIQGDGSAVFEETRVLKVDEDATACHVITDSHTVMAQDVVITTHLPILDSGLFFAKTYPKRSYIVGARIDPDRAPEGMFIGSGQGYFSIRTTPDRDGLMLLIGGGGHKVGEVTHNEAQYQKIEDFARSRFGLDTFDYRWSTQDMVSFDQLPYIGKLTPFSHRVSVATGFSLWGMTNGTLSGMLLSDAILGIDNPWANLYDATRATPFMTPDGVKQTVSVGMHWVSDRLKGLSASSLSEVGIGKGQLLTLEKEKLAVYRDQQGAVHAVSAVCPHLGCIVAWNSAEKSWDCPCHGSRFDCDGKVLDGPSVKDLKVHPV
jgi:glycine/D-amino acid oxidase-like deaminating enzyme/nitrite reductase/ring-hydroxylating ferredoxin subunit